MNDDRPDNEAQPDNVIALSKYRARLGRGRRGRRIESIMEQPDPRQAIRALPGDELYYLLREDDPREAKELLAYAKPEQVQVVLDFGLWSGDQLLPERMQEWIDVMAEMPFETIGEWIRGFDIELVALMLRKGARIYDLEIEDPPDEPRGIFYPTPDRFFVLDIVGYQVQPGDPDLGDPRYAVEPESDDDADAEAPSSARSLLRIVDALYRADLDLARRILVGAKAELDSQLEDMALRWRQGRMTDLGFVDAIEALEIYRELDPATVRIGELRPGTRMRPVGNDDTDDPPDLLRAPGVLGEHLGGTSLFARALGRVTSNAEIEELHFALVALTNRILAADRVDAADDRAAAASLHRMRATLDLAVEFLARGVGPGGGGGALDEDRAVDAVRTVAVIRLFRLGVSLVGKVRALARALKRRGPFAALAHLDLIEEPEATVLGTVIRTRPMYPSLLDDPPTGAERPFASLADIARVTAAIERAAVAQAILLGLGVRPEHLLPDALEGVMPSDAAEIDTGLLARTALVLLLQRRERSADSEQAAGVPDIFRPLTETEVAAFQRPGGRAAKGDSTDKTKPAKKIERTVKPTRAARPADVQEEQSDVLVAKAQRILEQASPPGMAAATRDMTSRWLQTLWPLEAVLVRSTIARTARSGRSDRSKR